MSHRAAHWCVAVAVAFGGLAGTATTAGAASRGGPTSSEDRENVFLATQGSALGRVLATRAPYIVTPYALGMTTATAVLPLSLVVAEVDKRTGAPEVTDPVRKGFALAYGGVVDLLYTTVYPAAGDGARRFFDAMDANAGVAAPVLNPLARPFSDAVDTFAAAVTAGSKALRSVGLDLGSPESSVNYGVYVLKYGTGAPD